MHALLGGEGWETGRDQTERLMKLAGVRGVRKSKRVFTTPSDKAVALPADLVNRKVIAHGLRKLWVCDVTEAPWVCWRLQSYGTRMEPWAKARASADPSAWGVPRRARYLFELPRLPVTTMP